MTEAEEDLSSNYQVQESRVILHPAYLKPVLLTRYGWAKRQGFFGERVRWYKQEVTAFPVGTSTQSTLDEWAGPLVTTMLGKAQSLSEIKEKNA